MAVVPILDNVIYTQHPEGTSTNVVALTLLNSLTAAGVLTEREEASTSPLIRTAISIGSTSEVADKAVLR